MEGIKIDVTFDNSLDAAIAFDKLLSQQQLTNTTFFRFRVPAPGFFDDDDVYDFMVRFNVGDGFPVYYHSNVRLAPFVQFIIINQR